MSMSTPAPRRSTARARSARGALAAVIGLSAATAGCSLGWQRSIDGPPLDGGATAAAGDATTPEAPGTADGGPTARAPSAGPRRTPVGQPPAIDEDLRVRLRVWDHPVPVDRVIDGDTLRVFTTPGHSESVRLIGMNAPETGEGRRAVQCFAKQATDRMVALIGTQDVWLAGDPTQTARDTYGRLLAYVWAGEGADAVLLNQALIAQGYANEATFGQPYAMRDAFRAAAADARHAQRGLWSPTTCAGEYDAPPVP